MRRWRSGQSQLTVNQSSYGLRRFKSYPTHKYKNTPLNQGVFLYLHFFTKLLIYFLDVSNLNNERRIQMGYRDKHYSKKDRTNGNGHHCTGCKKPLSGSRIKAQKTMCVVCETESRKTQHQFSR